MKNFNRRETGVQFDIGNYGVIGDPYKGVNILHSYEDWKEPIIGKKLHLSDKVKNEIGIDLVNVFHKLDY